MKRQQQQQQQQQYQQYQYSFCNNCGKYGSHTYIMCKHPITSIGLVAFRQMRQSADDPENSNTMEYLMIRRKDTLGFVDFIRGKYQIFDRDHIRNLVDEMTVDEKRRILTHDFKQLWSDLWGLSPNNAGHHQHCGEESHSRDKFQHLTNGVKSRTGHHYCLSDIVNKSTTRWAHSEWGFPKGRRNNQERDIVCALRESLEETGYAFDQSNVVQNVAPYEEIFMGSNLKCYKHKYFLALVDSGMTPTKDFDRCEVSKIKWMTLDECMRKIRPYNIEKMKLLNNIHNLITTHQFYN